MRLVLENTPKGLLQSLLPAFVRTRPEDVFGSLAWDGARKSLADMEAGVLAEAERRVRGLEEYKQDAGG